MVAITAVTDEDGRTTTLTGVQQSLTINVAEVQGTTLAVGGTTGNNSFIVTDGSAADTAAASLNGTSLGTFSGISSVFCYGQAGSDSVTVQGMAGNNNFTINGDAITVNDITVAGSSIESWLVDGLAGNDVFTVSSAAVTEPITIDGGDGTNTLIGPDLVNTWQLTGSGAGSLNSSIAFQNMDNLIGGGLADTLIGANTSNSWSLTGLGQARWAA